MSLEDSTKEAVRRCLDPAVPSLREAIEPVIKGAMDDANTDALGLRAEVESLRRCLEIEEKSTETVLNQLKAAELQVDELKKALYDECRGLACKDDGECEGGYRRCSGCEKRAKKAYGPGWDEVAEKQKIESTPKHCLCYVDGYGNQVRVEHCPAHELT